MAQRSAAAVAEVDGGRKGVCRRNIRNKQDQRHEINNNNNFCGHKQQQQQQKQAQETAAMLLQFVQNRIEWVVGQRQEMDAALRLWFCRPGEQARRHPRV